MREINVSEITNAVAKLCIDANCKLNSDVYNALENAKKTEESEIGKRNFMPAYGKCGYCQKQKYAHMPGYRNGSYIC